MDQTHAGRVERETNIMARQEIAQSERRAREQRRQQKRARQERALAEGNRSHYFSSDDDDFDV